MIPALVMLFSLPIYSQIYLQDSSIITVGKDAIVSGSIIKKKKEKVIIYVVGNVTLNNFKELFNYKIVYSYTLNTVKKRKATSKTSKKAVKQDIAKQGDKKEKTQNQYTISQNNRTASIISNDNQNTVIVPIQPNTFLFYRKDTGFSYYVFTKAKRLKTIFREILFSDSLYLSLYRVRPPPFC